MTASQVTPFGRALRILRLDRHWKLKDMAAGIGVSSSYLSAVEIGKKNAPYSLLMAIRIWSGLSVADYRPIIDAWLETESKITIRLPRDANIATRRAARDIAEGFSSLTESDIVAIQKIIHARRTSTP